MNDIKYYAYGSGFAAVSDTRLYFTVSGRIKSGNIDEGNIPTIIKILKNSEEVTQEDFENAIPKQKTSIEHLSVALYLNDVGDELKTL